MLYSEQLRQFALDMTMNSSHLTSEDIISLTIDAAPSQKNKFFGVVITQQLSFDMPNIKDPLFIADKGDKITIKLRQTNVTNDQDFNLFSDFYVSEMDYNVERKVLTIKAVDKFINLFKNNDVSKLNIQAPYTAFQLFEACCLKNKYAIDADSLTLLKSITYENGANLNGNETIYDLFIAFAELIGGYIYMDKDVITLQRMNKSPDFHNMVYPENYFKLAIEDDITLHKIIVGNSLGDNIFVETPMFGKTEFIRDNPLLDNRPDIAAIAQKILDNIGDVRFTKFKITWRGNKVNPFSMNLAVVDKKNRTHFSPIFNTKIVFDGGLKVESAWGYEPEENETFANPATVGERISQATAKVDKVNKKIELVVSEVEKNNEAIQENISRIDQDSKSLSASVEQVQKDLAATSDDLNGSIGQLTEKVNATMTKDQVKIEIEKEMQKGTSNVTTGTGFTFNEDGLTVSKKNNVMSTQITENGMYIAESGNTVLSANNVGVDAKNLHATTYLIIGQNSRFEDYGTDQTGCFWIGSGFGGLKAWR